MNEQDLYTVNKIINVAKEIINRDMITEHLITTLSQYGEVDNNDNKLMVSIDKDTDSAAMTESIRGVFEALLTNFEDQINTECLSKNVLREGHGASLYTIMAENDLASRMFMCVNNDNGLVIVVY